MTTVRNDPRLRATDDAVPAQVSTDVPAEALPDARTGGPPDVTEPRWVDVDAWLLDLARALDHAEAAQPVIEQLGRHVDRIESDPAYAAAVARLEAATRDWMMDPACLVVARPDGERRIRPYFTTRDASDYLVRHADDIKLLDQELRPPRTAPELTAGWRVWADELTSARGRVERARRAMTTLIALTGAADAADALAIARSKQPLLAWRDLDASIGEVDPEPNRVVLPATPGLGMTTVLTQLRVLVSRVEMSRARLGRAYLELQRCCDRDAVETLERHRRDIEHWHCLQGHHEQEFRDALRVLGYPEADGGEELWKQADQVLSTRPESLVSYLSHLRTTVDHLLALTHATTAEEAVHRARRLLAVNNSFRDEPERGVLVYSDGPLLPA